MVDDEPDLVVSRKGLRVVLEGHPFSIEIYRLEHEKQWTLEVVDAGGTSHVWDEHFDSEQETRDTAIRALKDAPEPHAPPRRSSATVVRSV